MELGEIESAIREASARVLDAQGAAALQYSTTEGHAPLREWIAAQIPGAAAERVHTMRTVADFRRLHDAVEAGRSADELALGWRGDYVSARQVDPGSARITGAISGAGFAEASLADSTWGSDGLTFPRIQGADVWLNTPRRPFEACGTSGMKAAVNGVLNVRTF